MSRRAGRLEVRAAAGKRTVSLDETADMADGMKVPLRQFISSTVARPCAGQPKQPCSDRPMAHTALPGWLGGATPDEYVRIAHSDAVVDCHTLIGPQCAGMAIYRANVAKRCGPLNLTLPKDPEACFSTPYEFLDHHSGKKL